MTEPTTGPAPAAWSPAATESDAALVDALRCGSEAGFRLVVTRHHAAMVRLAETYVPSRAVAEEVAQETWLAVLEGVGRFEGRSSLKTWIFHILVNRARTRGVREHRTTPFTSMPSDDAGTSVDPDRFLDDGHRWAGHWSHPPHPWTDATADDITESETLAVVHQTVQKLPDRQRQVITLRDIEGLTSQEVCSLLELSEVNQRVLLHRARSRVRAVLELHLALDG
jgi:RNA polymerase sigma-70 factor (ECF subfamily)